LDRHKKILNDFAKRSGMIIAKTFSEVVSGETLSSRPEMQKLLSEVEKGMWDGVLVMEVERLARGDTIDQGIVAQTFKYSNTKIITPSKTYDPNNEFDEEYFEFGLFMSRREYKTINRRLQQGKMSSIKEGKYLASIPPYGYKKQKLKGQKGYTLEIVEEEAKIVRLIFEFYKQGKGISNIAKYLNNIDIKPKVKEKWSTYTIRDMLQNPVYIGKIRWNFRKTKKNIVNGLIKKERPINYDAIIIKGIHESIIDDDLFSKIQIKMKSKKKGKSIAEKKSIKNPLAGIIICGKCGRTMVRKPGKSEDKAMIICPNMNCDNVSSYLLVIENKMKKYITKRQIHNSNLLSKYKFELNSASNNKEISILKSELGKLNIKLEKIYDSFEQGIYSKKLFISRKKQAEKVIVHINNRIRVLEKLKRNIVLLETNIPKLDAFINDYDDLISIEQKNKILVNIIEKIIYLKEKKGKKLKDQFTLKIFLKI
jgi:DNA invertase Pin-like site-specific DNA recombinase/ssDNA-binding Zn-finger/Zn-ribbon topoisomerase 1